MTRIERWRRKPRSRIPSLASGESSQCQTSINDASGFGCGFGPIHRGHGHLARLRWDLTNPSRAISFRRGTTPEVLIGGEYVQERLVAWKVVWQLLCAVSRCGTMDEKIPLRGRARSARIIPENAEKREGKDDFSVSQFPCKIMEFPAPSSPFSVSLVSPVSRTSDQQLAPTA